MYRLRENTHPACRSLLQKAVRRGDTVVARSVAEHLQAIGDGAWLRARAVLIGFEECWPLVADLDPGSRTEDTVTVLERVARSVKVKDAAGLGSLAFALSQGDATVLTGERDDRDIRIVCEAVRRPADFWQWATSQCSSDRQRALVEVAIRAHRRGGWPWDRAFMQAAAYLAVTQGVPEVVAADSPAEPSPLWVALDKHTPQGKRAIKEAARRSGLSPRQLTWTSFYFESAQVNRAIPSVWWQREVTWRMRRIGLDVDRGSSLWESIRLLVRDLLSGDEDELRRHLGSADYPSAIHTAGNEAGSYRQLPLP